MIELEIDEKCVICCASDDILFEIQSLSKGLKFCLELLSDYCLSEESYDKFLCLKCNEQLENAQKFRSKCLQSSFVLEKQKQKAIQKEKACQINLDDPEYDSDALIKEEESCKEHHENIVKINEQIDIELNQQPEIDDSFQNPGSIESQTNIDGTEEDFIVVVTEEITSNDKDNQAHLSNYTETCPECGKSFESITSFKRHHYRMHRMTRKTYSCNYKGCSATFKNGYRLNVHLRKHENISFICDFCQKSFYDKAYLVEHIKMVHLKSVPPSFKCDICGKLFNLKSKLTIHCRTHSETAKKHKCDVCVKKFRTKEKLTRHLLVHSGLRPYVCVYCSVAYKSSYALKKHSIKCT